MAVGRRGAAVKTVWAAFASGLWLACIAGAWAGDDTVVPEPLALETVRNEAPYAYGGLVVATFEDGRVQRGSGSIIGEHLVLTAAHVLYDAGQMEWASAVDFYPRFHKERTDALASTRAEGYAVWPEYVDSIEADDYDAFTQLDVAVLWNPDMECSRFPPLDILYPDAAWKLRTGREKLVLGYPQWTWWWDYSYVEEANDLTMHRFGPAPFLFVRSSFWPTEVLDRPYWNFANAVIPALPRNSGGPVYLREDDGLWACGGILTRGQNARSIYRMLGSDVLELIDAARRDANDGFMMPVLEAAVGASASTGAELAWEDTGATEDGYEIWMQDAPGEASEAYTRWRALAEVGPDVVTFRDGSAQRGAQGFYKIRPYQEWPDGAGRNYGPFSPVFTVEVPGQHAGIAEAVDEPVLHWRTGGTTNAQVVADGETPGGTSVLFAGLDDNGRCWVETRVTGPGTLTFNFETSTERNYDRFTFTINGGRAKSWSGETARRENVTTLGSGLQVLRWEYAKDKDYHKYRDRAYLHAVDWSPTEPAAHLPGGYAMSPAEDEGWFFTPWLGWYERSHFPWVYVYQRGWWYASPTDGEAVYFYSPDANLGWIYTTASIFPWVYSYQSGSWHYLTAEP